jgi:2-amino-4-hydroxy-6-hydroxymethyldihydropteridine diphosphokinase
LGSNLGERERNIEKAYKSIEKQIGRISSKSAFFYSAPEDFESKNNFVNTVCEVITILDIYEAFSIAQNIECQLGRGRKSDKHGYGDRIIDIDLILADKLIVNNDNLKIPHPRFHQRNFVLSPLYEIAPDIIHPLFGKTIRELKYEYDQLLKQ